jgi:hypothetical protein
MAVKMKWLLGVLVVGAQVVGSLWSLYLSTPSIQKKNNYKNPVSQTCSNLTKFIVNNISIHVSK